jgi:large subunit ribosomal protein L25
LFKEKGESPKAQRFNIPSDCGFCPKTSDLKLLIMAETREQVTVQAEAREGRGKNDSRRMRAEGKVPVTIYGGGGESVSATAKLSDLAAIIRSHGGANTIFSIAIEGMDTTDVMFHDRQIHPVKGRLIHADLKRIVRGQKLEITVPLHFEGEAIGVTRDGGILDQTTHELQVRCLPRDIPDQITADISGLEINDVMHVKDIKADDKLEILTDPEAVVATIKFISDAQLEESLTSQVEVAEPEVINDSASDKDDPAGDAKKGEK